MTLGYEHSFGVIVLARTKLGPQVLLVKHQAGHWGFPKGHAEGSETPIETAQRELAEETGLKEYTIDPNTALHENYNYQKEDGTFAKKQVTYFVAYLNAPEKLTPRGEIVDIGWFPLKEAISTVTHTESQDVLKRLAFELSSAANN